MERVLAVLKDRLKIDVAVDYARRLGKLEDKGKPRRIMFGVRTVWEAREVVMHRKLLKGTGLSIMDELTPEELKAHKLMWPKFLEARQEGKRAFLNRGRLFVEGVEVKP